MDVCTQYSKYVKFCKRVHALPESFPRFVANVFPHTVF